MMYEVTEKDVSPCLTVTSLEPCTLQNLEQSIYAMYADTKKNINGSFFCLSETPNCSQDSLLKIHCPVLNGYEAISDKKHKYEVVPRIKAISTIHTGAYDNLDGAFQAVKDYAEEKNLKIALPYRIVFHKEKRKWQRKRFFKRAVGEYVIELQAPMEQEEIVLPTHLGG